jgi:hypothetical protein
MGDIDCLSLSWPSAMPPRRFPPPLVRRVSIQSILGSGREIFLTNDKSIPQTAICFQWREAMIDSVLNVAVFAALVLCIVGFSAWAKSFIT